MSLTSDELVRLGEDILTDRFISSDLYCAECAYNLRTLPYRGRCPECGSDYNARQLWMDGIFTAGMLKFPTDDYLGIVFTFAPGVLLLASGINPVVEWRVMFGAVFLIIGALFIRAAWKHTGRYLHFRGIMRRIGQSEAD